ncbi:putative P-type ATPase, subfamily IV, P-type ATPase, A domain superfamily [Plasmopara halstedii]
MCRNTISLTPDTKAKLLRHFSLCSYSEIDFTWDFSPLIRQFQLNSELSFSYTLPASSELCTLLLICDRIMDQGASGDFRLVHLNDAHRNSEAGYCSNFIVTSKYTIVSFLPKFLFESFRKLSNLYFLVICILQCIPEISNTNGNPSTLPPLVFIIAVDGVFAILEDHKRHQADDSANASPTLVLDRESRQFKSSPWADVVVGDIVKISNRGLVPADILVLAVSETPNQPPCGICYVETKSLDGETNMKVRSAMERTLTDMGSIDNLAKMKGVVRCEHPNNAINSFQGVLELVGKDNAAIPYESIILRGCIIRNTDWVHGVVLNTGKDTKIMMSNSAPPSKMSSMDRSINQYTIVLLFILVIFSAVGATGAVSWKAKNKSVWYLALTASENGVVLFPFR